MDASSRIFIKRKLHMDRSCGMAKVVRKKAQARRSSTKATRTPQDEANASTSKSDNDRFGAEVRSVADNFAIIGKRLRESGDDEGERFVNAFGGLLMGCWLELHRIADALDHKAALDFIREYEGKSGPIQFMGSSKESASK